jgi:hypothetical protein
MFAGAFKAEARAAEGRLLGRGLIALCGPALGESQDNCLHCKSLLISIVYITSEEPLGWER